ncbi:MAG: nitroreductase [Candidatus Delongbacteria bacterium]
MNEVLKCIKNRRSCRDFKPDLLKEEDIRQIIDAGIWAPSGNNKQPWFFTVVRGKENVQKISDRSKANALKYLKQAKYLSIAEDKEYDLFYGAPCLIIVSADYESSTATADCSAAIQNMLLAAESLNIGSLWNGIIKRFWFDTAGVVMFKNKYNIPNKFQPLYAVALGYFCEKKVEGPERKAGRIKYL